MKRNKEGHYIIIKGSIQEEDITIINIYASNIYAPIGTLQYVRQMLTSMRGEINNNTIIVGDYNTPLRRRKWQPTPVLLPAKSHAPGSSVYGIF